MTGARAGAVVLAASGVAIRDESILLVQRGRPPDAGRWSVPGGRVEPGERVADAVVREVREETGLDVTVERFVGWVERIAPDASSHFVILDFVVALADASAEPAAGDDASAARFVPFAELSDLALVDGLLAFLVEHRLVPALR